MKRTNTYETTINEKFREFPFPDMDATWPDMKTILDREMPEKKRRGFYFYIAAFILGTCVLFLAVYNFENSTAGSKQNHFADTPSDAAKQGAEKMASPSNTEPASEIETEGNSKTKNETDQKTRRLVFEVNTADKKETNHNQKQNTISSELTAVGSESAAAAGIKNPDVSKRTKSTVQPIQKESFGDKRSGNEESDNKNTVTKDQLPEQADHFSATKANSNTDQSKVFIRERQKEIIHKSGLAVYEISSGKTKDSINKELAGLLIKKDVETIPGNDTTAVKASKPSSKYRGWVAGASLNYNLPVSNQEMSTVNINGKNSTLIDFLPSLYVQYHFNQKWHVESSLQFSSPQYISSQKLASEVKALNPNKREENAVWLNKLYYLNVPFSIHYRPLPNLTVGTGIQYSYLRRSIFEDELAMWERQPAGGWTKTASSKTVKVTSANGKGKPGNVRGGGPGSTPATPTPTLVDTVADTLRSSDWRMLFDVNYSWKRFNAGCRFNMGLNNYIETKAGNHILPVKDRNQTFQLYLRYDIIDKRKKQ